MKQKLFSYRISSSGENMALMEFLQAGWVIKQFVQTRSGESTVMVTVLLERAD